MRVNCAGAVLGASLVAAVWLSTYRVWSVVEHIDKLGYRFHPSERVRVSPWWSAPATVAVMFVGLGISLLLLRERPGAIKRFADRFVGAGSLDARDADSPAR
jgi:hypothetical protein